MNLDFQPCHFLGSGNTWAGGWETSTLERKSIGFPFSRNRYRRIFFGASNKTFWGHDLNEYFIYCIQDSLSCTMMNSSSSRAPDSHLEYFKGSRCGFENCKSTRYYIEEGLTYCQDGHQQDIVRLHHLISKLFFSVVKRFCYY